MVASRILVVSAVASALVIGAAYADAKRRSRKQSKRRVHVVERGQTLSLIARNYGCKVTDIRRVNQLKGDFLKIGQRLSVPRCTGKRVRGAPVFVHYVARGETLSKIARRYDCSVKHLKARNGLRNNVIHPGQKLRLIPGRGGRGRPIKGQAIGSPQRGRLENGAQLPRDRSYHRRRPYRAWGANHTVHFIRRVARIVRGKYRRVHPVAIGDLSAKRGGDLSPHLSHQSGLDVDVGFYFKKKPQGYPLSFIKGNKHNLHMGATWTMLRAYAATARSSGGVQKIFLDYKLQKLFYEWAKKKRRASRRTLRLMFQYPRGPGSMRGILRHEPGHDDHIHVRFKCPRRDKKCREL